VGTNGFRRHPAPVLLSLVLLGAAATGQAQDLRELSRDAQESVALLRSFDAAGRLFGSGTGFLVGDGVLATNYHVIEGATRIEAVFHGDRSVEVAGVLASDPHSDLALLEVPEGTGRWLPLTRDQDVEPGERVVVLGSPLGLAGTLSEGIVAALRPDGLSPEVGAFQDQPLIQISAPISPGSSGSPVMNLQGEVLGIAVSQFVYGQNLNFAVPVASLRPLMGRAARGVHERPLGAAAAIVRGAYLRNLAISAFLIAAIFVAFRYLRD
jgi:S1-C subfamily serine protease